MPWAAPEAFPPEGMVTSSSSRWMARTSRLEPASWSSTSRGPPGRSIRRRLLDRPGGSARTSSDRAHTTVSNEAAGNGSGCASPTRKVDGPAGLFGAVAGEGQHGRAELDAGQPDAVGIEREVQAGADGGLQHVAADRAADPARGSPNGQRSKNRAGRSAATGG